MGRLRGWMGWVGFLLAGLGCGEAGGLEADPWVWQIPAGLPAPAVPADNPMTEAKVALGRSLFFDPQISANGTQSCASCHDPALAFTDGARTSTGSTGELTVRSAMSLVNVAYNPTFHWADPDLTSLEQQVLRPLFAEDPVELGWAGQEIALVTRLEGIEGYPARFAEAFPEDPDPIRVENLARVIAAFERTLLSGDSPYDRYLAGDEAALSEAALRGMELFFGEELECFHCHGGFNFTQASVHEGTTQVESPFHNTGLYDLDGRGAYPASDQGLIAQTEHPADMGKFRAPTLRNVAVTAPYMHDGSVADLDAALDHYARGGRLIEDGPNAGDGRGSFLKSGFVNGFSLSPSQRADILAFLHALTDERFLTDPTLRAPE